MRGHEPGVAGERAAGQFGLPVRLKHPGTVEVAIGLDDTPDVKATIG